MRYLPIARIITLTSLARLPIRKPLSPVLSSNVSFLPDNVSPF